MLIILTMQNFSQCTTQMKIHSVCPDSWHTELIKCFSVCLRDASGDRKKINAVNLIRWNMVVSYILSKWKIHIVCPDIQNNLTFCQIISSSKQNLLNYHLMYFAKKKNSVFLDSLSFLPFPLLFIFEACKYRLDNVILLV